MTPAELLEASRTATGKVDTRILFMALVARGHSTTAARKWLIKLGCPAHLAQQRHDDYVASVTTTTNSYPCK